MPRQPQKRRYRFDPPPAHRGRYEARKKFPIEGKRCSGGCGKPAAIRHHRNGNPHDNAPSNIQFLCRACHVRLDRRIKPRSPNR